MLTSAGPSILSLVNASPDPAIVRNHSEERYFVHLWHPPNSQGQDTVKEGALFKSTP